MAQRHVTVYQDTITKQDINGDHRLIRVWYNGIERLFDLDSEGRDFKILKAYWEQGETPHQNGKAKSNVIPINRDNNQQPARTDRAQSQAMRQWAVKHVKGSVGPKGRIPVQIQDAYHKNDPKLIPGYVEPKVTAVTVNLSEGGTKANVSKAAPKVVAQKRATKAAPVKEAKAG